MAKKTFGNKLIMVAKQRVSPIYKRAFSPPLNRSGGRPRYHPAGEFPTPSQVVGAILLFLPLVSQAVSFFRTRFFGKELEKRHRREKE
jgi:hypothetical protein